ncbi:MAG: Wzz/FepE/Etk N-terminal domain-containing protein [Thermoleophilia bacterium]
MHTTPITAQPMPADIPADDPGDLVRVAAQQPSARRALTDAVIDRPLLLVLPTLVGLLLGLAYGLLRTPTYTAEARLAVARIDVQTQALPAMAAAVQSLAVTYARLTTADAVIKDTADVLNVSQDTVRGRLSASPIPGSPLFRIEASAGSSADAIATANAAGSALKEYVARINGDTTTSVKFIGLYQLAVRDRADDAAAVRAALRVAAKHRNPITLQRVSNARARLAGAQLRVAANQALYQESLAGQTSTRVIQTLNPAARASSDRASALQRWVLILTALGLLVGLVLVMWLREPVSSYQPQHARTS